MHDGDSLIYLGVTDTAKLGKVLSTALRISSAIEEPLRCFSSVSRVNCRFSSHAASPTQPIMTCSQCGTFL
jgi:hypothetical protein